MTELVPDYYDEFHCIASACRHNCCIGWEIDIDGDTAAYYAGVEEELGARLRKNVIPGDPARFRLTEEERCPFLNENNLCDLILSLGESSLCEICTEHPRFHNRYGDREESGLGLCCEAAAALIMGKTTPFTVEIRGNAPEKDAAFALREQILRTLTDRSMTLEERFQIALRICGGTLPHRSPQEWITLFRSLEQMEPGWTDDLRDLEDNYEGIDFAVFRTTSAPWAEEYEQLACYFVFRHFLNAAEDFGAASALGFAMLGCGLIYALQARFFQRFGHIDFDTRMEYARRYSAEIEYSDENPELLLSALISGLK